MRKSTAELIDHLILASVSDGNHDVYETMLKSSPNFEVVPWVVYFYYISFGNKGQPLIKHYFHNEKKEIPLDAIQGKIKELALRAKNQDPTLRHIGDDFHDIVWKHKCYIAIFMDSPHWKVLKRESDPLKSAIVFNTKKEGAPNNTFFDADDFELDMGTDGIAETRSAVYFINHMKKSEFGDDIGYDQAGKPVEQSEKYSFDVYFDVSRDVLGPSTVFIIDPDGTNTGPPQPPPPG